MFSNAGIHAKSFVIFITPAILNFYPSKHFVYIMVNETFANNYSLTCYFIFTTSVPFICTMLQVI